MPKHTPVKWERIIFDDYCLVSLSYSRGEKFKKLPNFNSNPVYRCRKEISRNSSENLLIGLHGKTQRIDCIETLMPLHSFRRSLLLQTLTIYRMSFVSLNRSRWKIAALRIDLRSYSTVMMNWTGALVHSGAMCCKHVKCNVMRKENKWFNFELDNAL